MKIVKKIHTFSTLMHFNIAEKFSGAFTAPTQRHSQSKCLGASWENKFYLGTCSLQVVNSLYKTEEEQEN